MGIFSNLSNPVKGIIAGAGVAGVAVTGFLMSRGSWLFPIILVLLLVLLAGGYLAIVAIKRRKQNARLGGELQQHSSASPQGISDPGQRARLDDLRKKFEQGVHEYRSRGKDLYTLPWYVIVGEPGSGKTEAVRHSNVGFPSGMQDEFQGVGGTINMNWWFTNQAVLLDTAGRLMFEEVKPGETSEWKEFLTLLKKNRPNCPINGLFLIIPSDSLIRDSADKIALKAGKIAQQLDVIQRVLDVRFPVFVVVTKCDKVNGFREFFDGLTDPQLQHQIMGWTNPDPLDAAFRPELVDRHLDSVADRLRKRRLGLLRDPVSDKPDGRRCDEVDSLYALPHSLSLLAPRLRRYLETVFVAGEWSAKPLFLRGIFFTSSMREGAALDEELANAIGMQVDDLPEGKVWERDRAYFLRDLFLEKVFREKGLVTRAPNTNQMLRRRQMTLLGTVAVGLLLLVTMAWFSMGALRNEVLGRSQDWDVVSSVGWKGKLWNGSIIPVSADGQYASYATNQIWTTNNASYALGEFHARLQERASSLVKDSLLTPGLASTYNGYVQKSQRIVFENGVVKPLLEASRQKMMGDLSSDAARARYLPAALAAMIRLEADLWSRKSGENPGVIAAEEAERLLATLQSFVTGSEATVDPALVSTMAWTYSVNEEGKGLWPPDWASGGTGVTNSLDTNPSLRAGLDQFIAITRQSIQTQVDGWKQTQAFRDALDSFKSSEQALYQAAIQANAGTFKTSYQNLKKAKSDIDEQRAQLRKLEFFGDGTSLTNAYARFQSLTTAGIGQALAPVRLVNEPGLADPANRLFFDIQARLKKLEQEQLTSLKSFDDPDRLKKLEEQEAFFFVRPGAEDRWALHEEVNEAALASPFEDKKLVGQRGAPLEDFLRANVEPIPARAGAYAGPLKMELKVSCDFASKLADAAQRAGFLAAYMREVETEIGKQAGFPLLRNLDKPMALEACNEFKTYLGFIIPELESPVFSHPSSNDNPSWKKLRQDMLLMNQTAQALLDRNGRPANCQVLLEKMDAQLEATKDHWRIKYRKMAIGDGSEWKDTNIATDDSIADVAVNKEMTVRIAQRENEGDKHDYPVPSWGPLWLLHKFGGSQGADASTWAVEVPVNLIDPSAKGQVRLLLKFEKPLPKIELWPSR